MCPMSRRACTSTRRLLTSGWVVASARTSSSCWDGLHRSICWRRRRARWARAAICGAMAGTGRRFIPTSSWTMWMPPSSGLSARAQRLRLRPRTRPTDGLPCWPIRSATASACCNSTGRAMTRCLRARADSQPEEISVAGDGRTDSRRSQAVPEARLVRRQDRPLQILLERLQDGDAAKAGPGDQDAVGARRARRLDLGVERFDLLLEAHAVADQLARRQVAPL